MKKTYSFKIVLILIFILTGFNSFPQNKDSLNRALFDDIKKFYFEDAKKLIDLGADVNYKDSKNASVVMWAAYRGNTDLVRYLIAKGADASRKGIIDIENGTYGSPLIAAAGEGKLEIVKCLIENGKVNIDDPEITPDGKNGWTALLVATYNIQYNIVEYLLSKGANINLKCNDDGCTALMYAAQKNNAEIFKLLLNKGADLEIKNENGLTALMYAAKYKNAEYVKLLIEKGADVDVKNVNGWTALHYASKYGFEDIKALLLKKCKDKSGLNWKDSWFNNYQIIYKMLSENNYKDAMPGVEKNVKQAETEFGKESFNYSESLNNLATYYNYIGKYDDAESLFLEVLKIKKKIYGEKSFEYASSINNFGMLYQSIGNYSKAENLYKEAIEIYKETIGEKNHYYSFTINNLGVVYELMGFYSKAEIMFKQSLNIDKEISGEKSYDYATKLNNIGQFYYMNGDYSKAENLYLEALKINQKTLGEKNAQNAIYLNNLSTLYFELGNFQKAEQTLLESLKIVKEARGEKTENYITGMSNLSLLYNRLGKYEKAEPIMENVLKSTKEIFGDKHPLYANAIYNLAILYDDMGKYEKSEQYFLEALKIRKEVLGDKHPVYAANLNNLAMLYKKTGHYDKAEDLLKETAKIMLETFGEKQTNYIASINNLAAIYFLTGNYAKAEPLFLQSSKGFIEQLQESFNFLSEKEQQMLLNTINDHFKVNLSFVYKYQKEKPSITEMSYNNELALKSALLSAGIQLRQSIYLSKDTALNKIYNYLNSVKQNLSKQYSMPKDKRTIDVTKLEEEANVLEKELIQKSDKYRNIKESMNIGWREVQKNLKQDEAAIEFVHFNYFNGKKFTDSILYCALVLKLDYKSPKMIYLFEEKQLQELIQKKEHTSDKQFINSTYANNDQLFNLIWKPIESSLGGIKKVYLAPSGLLNKISFAAIQMSGSGSGSVALLSEKYNINTLTSTRQVALQSKVSSQQSAIRSNEKITSGDYLVVYGGIKYDVDSTKLTQLASLNSNTNLNTTRSINIPKDSTRGSDWHYLPGTLTEAQEINAIFEKNKISSKLITAEEATEESFKALSADNIQQATTVETLHATSLQSPSIIHIATHGFFFPDPKTMNNEQRTMNNDIGKTNVFKFSDNPLLRSGLIMAGANRVWKGLSPLPGVEDGILTAYEVATLNLSNTKLVTMSACETGLGDIEGNEGVFGLQRAFKMAGVDYIIMSLWQVPDKETSEFMETFYTKWLSGSDIETAFTSTQRDMQKKYPEPYKWAAFELIK